MVQPARPIRSRFARHAARHLITSSCSRVQTAIASRWLAFPLLAQIVPRVSARNVFHAHPTNDTGVANDTASIMTFFDYASWQATASAVRNQPNADFCFGNLSLLLSTLGPLNQTDLNGSSSALTLLPTAGALVGAPSQELWVLFKLVPLAGVLSMLLSLGGSIIPPDAREYNANFKAFSYGGFIATAQPELDGPHAEVESQVSIQSADPEQFAARVRNKAMEHIVSQGRTRIWIGIVLQVFWIGAVIATCCFVQSGGILVWWCKMQAWMLIWYFAVAASSVVANFAGVPFSYQWTIRVSQAPSLQISEHTPAIVACNTNAPSKPEVRLSSTQKSPLSDNCTSSTSKRRLVGQEIPLDDSSSSGQPVIRPAPTPRSGSVLLHGFQRGFNPVSSVSMDRSEPWAASRDPFYVIISVEGLSKRHAFLRVLSKAFSVAVFATGTCFFASSTLIWISVAVAALCLILGAGMFGRVIAMWMANELIREEPVLHKIVRNRREAGEYLQEMLAQPGLAFEINGHVVVDGRCIERYRSWARWSTYLGVLSPPPRFASVKK